MRYETSLWWVGGGGGKGGVEGGIHLLASMSSPVEHEVEIVRFFLYRRVALAGLLFARGLAGVEMCAVC